MGVGGSSSGSAAAVACGFAAGSLGTETTGSVLSPACQHSLVGIKSTVGLVSRSGVISVSFTQNTIGTLAKTITDATLILSAIRGQDERYPAILSSSEFADENYRKSLQGEDLTGIRIGIPREVYFDGLDDEGHYS